MVKKIIKKQNTLIVTSIHLDLTDLPVWTTVTFSDGRYFYKINMRGTPIGVLVADILKHPGKCLKWDQTSSAFSEPRA